MTLVFRDNLFLEHDTGRHPENANRLRAIHALLDQSGLAARCQLGTIQPATEAELAPLHDPQMIQLAREAAGAGIRSLDADTVVSAASYNVALAAAGACRAAVDAVLTGVARNALCLVRPPGHHATPTRSMGFCLFNNIALAARHAIDKYQLARVLIVDWDVHHGNGTQDIFYADGQILFYSMHRYGGGFYPGTGAADETGAGRGLGYTVNVPVRHGITRADFLSRFRATLHDAADKIRPELVLVSAGFDAHHLDPVGSLSLEAEDYSALTRVVLDIAQTHCHGRLVSSLEGGYHLQALAESVKAHMEELVR